MKILTAKWVVPINIDPIVDGAVAVIDGVIAGVGPRDQISKDFPAAETEDFGSAAILPGFVNCHSHLELTAMRGYLDDVEEHFVDWLLKLTRTRGEVLSAEDIEVSAAVGALEGALAGVTCFGDIGRFGFAGLKALKETGLRGVVFQETEFSPSDATASEDLNKLVEKVEVLSNSSDSLVEIGISPHSPYTVSRSLFEKIASYSIDSGRTIAIHAAESAMEDELMRYGTGQMAEIYRSSGIEFEPPGAGSIPYLAATGILDARPLLVHCINADEQDLRTIKKSGSKIAHCPKSNAKFGHGTAPFESMLDLEIAVGLGSDSVASNNTCDMIEEARFAALIARNRPGRMRFLNPKEVVGSMTLGGASALGMEKVIGTLEKGKSADLAVLSFGHISQLPVNDVYSAILFSSSARDVLLTMVAGNEVCRSGRSTRVDEADLRQRLAHLTAKL